MSFRGVALWSVLTLLAFGSGCRTVDGGSGMKDVTSAAEQSIFYVEGNHVCHASCPNAPAQYGNYRSTCTDVIGVATLPEFEAELGRQYQSAYGEPIDQANLQRILGVMRDSGVSASINPGGLAEKLFTVPAGSSKSIMASAIYDSANTDNGTCGQSAPTTLQVGASCCVSCGPSAPRCADGLTCVTAPSNGGGIVTGGTCQVRSNDQPTTLQEGASCCVSCGPSAPRCAEGLTCVTAPSNGGGIVTGGTCQ